MFPKVFGCLEHTSNCFIFSISRPKWPERNKINLYSWISSRCSGEKAVPQTKRTPERRFAKEANVGGWSSRAFCTRWAGIDFIAIVSIEKQTCINLDKEIGEYVVDIIYGGARKGHRIFLFKTQVLFFKTHVFFFFFSKPRFFFSTKTSEFFLNSGFFFQNPGFLLSRRPLSFFLNSGFFLKTQGFFHNPTLRHTP